MGGGGQYNGFVLTMHFILPKHFYLLDIVKGLAILKVILWHWQHFFYPYHSVGPGFDRVSQPLYCLLYIFYEPSKATIPFFFSLSGFTFFWLYSARVAKGTISSKTFFLSRLARLYPLHIVTLVAVAVGQCVYSGMTHASFVYSNNDVVHFIMNLFLVSAWGRDVGFSFNGPVWLLSVQMLMYILFYVFCRNFNRNAMALVVVMILGSFLAQNVFIALGIKYFFFGGILFVVYERIVSTDDPWKVSIWLPFVTAALWFVTLLVKHPYIHLIPEINSLCQKPVLSNWAVVVLLPLTILSLALWQAKKSQAGQRFSKIGDITYSMYLLHFPLQLLAVIGVVHFNVDPQVFNRLAFMILFFMALVLASWISRQYFETPIKKHFLSGLAR